MLLDILGETAGQEFFPQLWRQLVIAIVCLLPGAQPPPAILHDVGVEHIRADIERIMWLEIRQHPFAALDLEDFARDQHADALAANKTGPDLA